MKYNILEQVLNLIYPPVCGICGKINSNYICKECINEIDKIRYNNIDEYSDSFFHKHYSAFKYEGIIRKMLIEYKFYEKSYLYKTLEKILINNKNICEFIKAYDIIIPVPIHKNRKKERGYNQSSLIIKEFSKELSKTYEINLEFNSKILFKTKNTNKQSLLNKYERKINIKNAYKINENMIKSIKNKQILIFDDIYTTGSTVNECAKIIKKGCPKQIDVFTYAKD